ncbi:MAG: peptidylprolyl isomerase [Hyphomicrobiaceae bacterium]
MLFRVLLVWLFLAAASFATTTVLAADQTPAPLKLYCGSVTTELGWSGTLPYTLQICPLDSEGCIAEKRPFSLQPKLDQADSNTHCHFFDRPVKYLIEYNANYTGGRDYVAQELVPIGFDWRGLYPDVWCLEDGAAYFTNIDGKLALRAGYFQRVIRQACGWRDPIDEKLPPPNSDLPPELVGAWVPERKECPGIFDDAARTGDLLWIQPHGIDRADGACWLTGLFPLTPKLPVDTLCATKKGYKRTSFTFDRIKGDTMRLREGRKRRVTYKRCEKTWLVAPEQRKAADKLKGQTLSFVLDLDTQMRSLKSGKTGPIVSQERKIELKVGDDKTLTDRMQIGDGPTLKAFKTRFGEIAIDSEGDRTTWLVDDGKLKRVRERKSYYEILSWPLSPDGKSVTCEAKLEFAPTRSDGKLRSVATDRKEYEVVKAEITGQRCPKEPLLFAVAAANKREQPPAPSSNESLEKCLSSWVDPTPDSKKGNFELSVGNECKFGIVVVVEGSLLKRPAILDLAGSVGRLGILRTVPFSAKAGSDPKKLIETFSAAAITAERYNKSCSGIDVEDAEKARACFDKVNGFVKSPSAQAKPSADADTCIVNKTIGKAGGGSKDSHFVSITNDCPFEPVVAVRGPWLRGRGLISPAPSKDSGVAIGYSWGVNLPAGANPDELFKQLEFAALSLAEFRRSCDAGVFDTDLELRFECFANAYDEKRGKRDWAIPLSVKAGLAAAEEMERQAADKCIKKSMEKTGEKTDGGALRYKLWFENTCKYGLVLRVQQPGTSEAAAALLPDQSARELAVKFDSAVDTDQYLKRLEVSALTLEDYKRSCGAFRENDQGALKCFGKVYVAKHGEPDWAKRAQEKIKQIQESKGCPGANPDASIKACTAEVDALSGAAKSTPLNNRGAAYFNKGDYEKAVADYTQALRFDPKNADAYRNRAIANLRQKKYELAIADLDKTIAIETFAPLKPYRQRAEAYAALGEHAKAWKDADEALKIDPKDDKARALKKASAQAAFGPKPGDWAEFYAESCSQNEDPELRVNACLALIKEGTLGAEDLALAHVYIGQVAEAISKNDFFAKRKESAQKNIRSALNHYALAIKADMKNPIGYAEIGNVLIAAKKFDHAEQWLRKGEHAAPTSRLICDRLVLLYERKGDTAARDKQNGRCEILPKGNPFRKIVVGSAQGKALPSEGKSADATQAAKPTVSQRFDTGEKVIADECLVHKLDKSTGKKGSYDLKLINECDFPVMAVASGWPNSVPLSIITRLDAKPDTRPVDAALRSWKLWTIELDPKKTPEEELKGFIFQAVTSDAYAESCASAQDDKDKAKCFSIVRLGAALADPSSETGPEDKSERGSGTDTGEKVHVRHILLKSESEAQLAEKVLKGGADFAQTAKSLSTDEATAAKGGDLGWLARGKMLKPFEEAAFALKPGEISAPVKTQFGWHVIKREER